MDDFEEELRSRFSRDADAITPPPGDPAAIAGRARRARVRQTVTRGSAGLALVVALGILVSSLGGDRTPTVEIVQPTDGSTMEPTESLPAETAEPSPSQEPTTGQSEPGPPPRPEYVPPSMGGDYSLKVTYESLVSDDTNEALDVYRIGDGAPVLVSISDSEVVANGNSETSGDAMSSDGRYVAFWSSASNLVENDDDDSQFESRNYDVFIRDLFEGTTELIPFFDDDGHFILPATPSGEISMSSNGKHVAFDAVETGATYHVQRVYIHHMDTATTEVASVDSSGQPVWGGIADVSETGRFVVFIGNDGMNGSKCDPEGCDYQVYLRDMTGQTTELISVAADGSKANGQSNAATLSGDGQSVRFYSCATNLIDPAAEPPSPWCIPDTWYVRDRVAGATSPA